MFLELYFIVSIAGLLYATCSDLKDRIIPNWLTYGMIALGLGLHLVQGLFEGMSIFYASAFVAAITFVCAYALWKLGVWAGGDVKMFTALGALNPWNYAVIGGLLGAKLGIFGSVALPVFPLTLFVFSVLAMLPYGIILSLRAVVLKKALRKKFADAFKAKAWKAAEFSIAIISIERLLAASGIDLYLGAAIAVLAVVALAIMLKFVRYVVIALLFGWAVSLGMFAWFAGFAVLFSAVIAVYAFIKLHEVSRREALEKEMKISNLKEGEISAETIAVEKGKVKRYAPMGIGELWGFAKKLDLDRLLERMEIKGRVVVNARKAGGVTEAEIRALRKLVKEGKMGNSIRIKLSLPLVPAVLIAFVVLSLVGDIIWNVLFLA